MSADHAAVWPGTAQVSCYLKLSLVSPHMPSHAFTWHLNRHPQYMAVDVPEAAVSLCTGLFASVLNFVIYSTM
jgi:hypothetical protein